MKIELETNTIRGIPALTLAPTGAQALPAVFFISGYAGSKESGLSIGYRLARRGCFFISFDAALHGERYDPRLERAADPALGGIYPPGTGIDTWYLFIQVIHQCLQDVETLISHFHSDPRVDTRRCGVTGLSMGGYASFLIFSRLPQVQAAVPMIGVPSFLRRWNDLLDECAYSNPEWVSALAMVEDETRKRTRFIAEADPYEQLKQAAPRALLIMNCDFDTDQPKHYAIDLYRELLPSYAGSPENLKLNIYPVGHVVTAQMEQDAVEWFCQHLARGEGKNL